MGPLQANMSPEQGGELISRAILSGVNFFDTAESYGTYAHLYKGMRAAGRQDIVISSKTYAHTKPLAEKAVEQARKALNRDMIDIFLLHEQESVHTLRGHAEALDFLYTCKAKGIVRAVGMSTHHIAGVYGAVEKGLDIVHPMLNLEGYGILDGTRAEMETACRAAQDAGLGVFSMKALAGGNLFSRSEECLRYILSLPFIDAVAVGCKTETELDADISFFKRGTFSEMEKRTIGGSEKTLHIADWCEGCGQCVAFCPQGALTLKNGKAVCSREPLFAASGEAAAPELNQCVLCGYCGARCPLFAIKIY